jgi:hypothetical protein
VKLGTGEGVIKPYQAGEALAATIGALPVPLSGPPLPSRSASLAPLGPNEACELTAAYVRGLRVGSALEAESRGPAGEPTQAPDLQRILDALPGLTKPGVGRPAAIFSLTGIVAGAVIRSVGERHGDEALKRVANAFDDLGGLPSALLTPDGRIVESVMAGANLTCDLLAVAMRPPGKARDEDPNNELTGRIVLRADEFRQAIGFAVQILSPEP